MRRLLYALPLLFAMMVVLAGCGGGGGTTSSDRASSSTSSEMMSTSSGATLSPATTTQSAPPVVETSYVSGTVAVGAPLPGASVTLTDSRGATVSATADENGRYQCAVTGMSRPFLMHAQSNGNDMYAIAHDGDVMNANPVSDRIARLAAMVGGTTPQALFDVSATHGMPTADGMRTMTAAVMSAMGRELQSVGLDPASFDPTTTPFAANHTGFDALLDHMQVTADGITLTHDGETVTCDFAVGQAGTSSSTMTMTVTTTDGTGHSVTTTSTMSVPMHEMHDGSMMGGGSTGMTGGSTTDGSTMPMMGGGSMMEGGQPLDPG